MYTTFFSVCSYFRQYTTYMIVPPTSDWHTPIRVRVAHSENPAIIKVCVLFILDITNKTEKLKVPK